MSDYKFTSHRLKLNKDLEESTATALEVIGQTAEGYAKANAPVDTGRLRNSITHQQEDKNTEIISTNVEYAVFQEYGTSTGIKPKHFMKKAAEGHKAEYQQILAEYIKK